MTYTRKVHKRCANCANDHKHDFTLKVIKDDEGYWVAQGAWETEQEAIAIIDQTVNAIEEQNNKHKA